MTLFTCRCSSTVPSPIYISSSSPSPAISLSFRPIAFYNQRKPTSLQVPATDRVIDFGKYKGRMLGTLPSKYLRWVSKNLQARDFEEWAKLADQVLEDPVYKDRLEWELAEQVLTGNDPRASRTESAASDLLEISRRFGWDNEDKAAWSGIDFELIGTTKGRRIPRIGSSESRKSELSGDGERGLGASKTLNLGSSVTASGLLRERKAGIRDRRIGEMTSLEKGLGSRQERKMDYSSGVSMASPDNRRKFGSLGRDSSFPRTAETKVGLLIEHSSASKVNISGFSEGGRKMGILSKGVTFSNTDEEEYLEEGIVRGRREERRQKRNLQMQSLKKEVGVEEERANGNTTQNQNRQGTPNPFPGREALLRKANRLRK
ncbi:hypothetical protein ACLOJK_011253 [Asimina triloba]